MQTQQLMWSKRSTSLRLLLASSGLGHRKIYPCILVLSAYIPTHSILAIDRQIERVSFDLSPYPHPNQSQIYIYR